MAEDERVAALIRLAIARTTAEMDPRRAEAVASLLADYDDAMSRAQEAVLSMPTGADGTVDPAVEKVIVETLAALDEVRKMNSALLTFVGVLLANLGRISERTPVQVLRDLALLFAVPRDPGLD